MTILFWDRSGFVLYRKRLEKGGPQLPYVDACRKHVEMEPARLAIQCRTGSRARDAVSLVTRGRVVQTAGLVSKLAASPLFTAVRWISTSSPR